MAGFGKKIIMSEIIGLIALITVATIIVTIIYVFINKLAKEDKNDNDTVWGGSGIILNSDKHNSKK